MQVDVTLAQLIGVSFHASSRGQGFRLGSSDTIGVNMFGVYETNGTMGADSEARDEPSAGVIYACVEEGGQFVKIGWAASIENAYVRWINIQIGNPRRVEMHLLGDGSLENEAELHSQLREYAVRGEWFRIEAEVKDVLATTRPLPSRGGGGRPPTERSAAEQWLIKALSAGPRLAGDVFAAGVEAGHSQKTVRRAADALGVLRDPPGGGRRCRWLLPLADSAGIDV